MAAVAVGSDAPWCVGFGGLGGKLPCCGLMWLRMWFVFGYERLFCMSADESPV